MSRFITRLAASCSVLAVSCLWSGPMLAQTYPPGMQPLINTNGAWGYLGCISVPSLNNGSFGCWSRYQREATVSIDQSGNVVLTKAAGTESVSLSTYPGKAYAVHVGSNNGNATANISGDRFNLASLAGPDGRTTFVALLAHFSAMIPSSDLPNLQANLAKIRAYAAARGLVAADGSILMTDFYRVGSAYGHADDLKVQAVNGRVTVAQFIASLPPGTTPEAMQALITRLRPDANGTVNVNSADALLFSFMYNRRYYDTIATDAMFSVYASDSRGISVYSRSGVATLNNAAGIYMQGDRNAGIRVSSGQPASGGTAAIAGGSAVVTNSGDISVAGTDGRAISVGVIGGPSIGLTVQIMNSGDLRVIGDRGIGVRANTTAVTSGGASGNVSVENSGSVLIYGYNGMGIYADGAGSARVNVINSGAISVDGTYTYGSNSVAVYAALVPGATGGGRAAITNTGTLQVNGYNAFGLFANGLGGSARIENTGNIRVGGVETYNAVGMYAQSITSATVENNARVFATTSIEGRAVGVSAAVTASAETAGSVSIVNNGRVAVVGGDGSTGVRAVLDGAGPNTTAGTVSVVNGGYVAVNAAGGMGLFAYNGTGGSTYVSNNADVRMLGASSTIGILAASSRRSADDTYQVNGSGSVTVDIGTLGRVRGGAGSLDVGPEGGGSAAVVLAGGAHRTLNNAGRIWGDNGLAVFVYDFGGLSSTTINNSGRIDGSILSNSAAAINVFNSGTIYSGAALALGSGTLLNSGILSIGYKGQVATTTLIGNFVMAQGGRVIFDIDGKSSGQRADLLNVVGNISLGGGRVIANVISGPNGVGDRFTIATASGSISITGASISSTAGFRFAMAVAGNGHSLELTTTRMGTLATMAVAADTGSARAMAAQLTAVEDAAARTGNSGWRTITDAVRLQSDDTAAAQSMARLAPISGAADQQSAQRSVGAFANAMLSCSSPEGGDGKFAREEQCLYATAKYRQLNSDATSNQTGGVETGQEFMAGVQLRMWDNWRFGVALGHEEVRASHKDETQALGNTSGGRLVGGLTLKNQWGPWNAYLSLVGSQGRFDHTRQIGLAGVGAVANSSQDISSAGVKGRVAYTFDNGAWYVRPMVDVGTTYTSLGGYTETGGGAANLVVERASIWQSAITPALQIGGQIGSGGVIVRPYARVGAMFLSSNDLVLTGAFAEGPAGLAPFSLQQKSDKAFLLIDTGATLQFGGTAFKINYEGLMSRNTDQHAVTGKVSVNF